MKRYDRELPVGWERRQLKEISEIASGVTKGRKFNDSDSVDVPYLRVANVQEGRLDLQEVKTIQVHSSEIEKYRLRVGDLLMTEGGDRDKLGRGTIWRGEIETCIHQNHVFRVRPDRTCILPEYLNAYLGTTEAKAYFLRAAKQTTGIASINMTQLSEFPVILPPLGVQERIANILDRIESIRQKRRDSVRACHDLKISTFVNIFGHPQDLRYRWQSLSLEKVVHSAKIGLVRSSSEMTETGQYPYLRMDAIVGDGSLRLTPIKRTNASPREVEEYSLRRNDFLFNRV